MVFYNWNIVKSGIKHHNPNPKITKHHNPNPKITTFAMIIHVQVFTNDPILKLCPAVAAILDFWFT
jgi:hypothetical protein